MRLGPEPDGFVTERMHGRTQAGREVWEIRMDCPRTSSVKTSSVGFCTGCGDTLDAFLDPPGRTIIAVASAPRRADTAHVQEQHGELWLPGGDRANPGAVRRDLFARGLAMQTANWSCTFEILVLGIPEFNAMSVKRFSEVCNYIVIMLCFCVGSSAVSRQIAAQVFERYRSFPNVMPLWWWCKEHGLETI